MALFQFLFCFVARKLGIFVVFLFLLAGNRDFFFFSQAVALFDFFFCILFFVLLCWREIGDFFSLCLLAGNWGFLFFLFFFFLGVKLGIFFSLFVGGKLGD